MAKNEDSYYFRLVGRIDNIGACIAVIMFASMSLYLILAGWGLPAVIGGIFSLLATFIIAFLFFDNSGRQLVVSEEGLHLRTRFREYKKIIAWECIETVIVPRESDGHFKSDILIVGYHPTLPSNAKFHRTRASILHEPPGRPLILISRHAPDLNTLLHCLQERVPDVFQQV